MFCCSEDGQTKSHVHDYVIVSRGLEREIDSVKAIGLKVGAVGEESNVMKSDENTKQFQNVVGRISAVEFDPRSLRESRQTEIDFVNQSDVHRKHPRHSIIPTKWVDERHSRLCE